MKKDHAIKRLQMGDELRHKKFKEFWGDMDVIYEAIVCSKDTTSAFAILTNCKYNLEPKITNNLGEDYNYNYHEPHEKVYVPHEFEVNKEFAKKVCAVDGLALRFFDAMKNDYDLCKIALNQNICALSEVKNETILNDRDFCLNLVKQNPILFFDCNMDFKRDNEFINIALDGKLTSHQAEMMFPYIKNDKELVLKALTVPGVDVVDSHGYGKEFKFSKELASDRDVVKAAVESRGRNLHFFKDFNNDYEMAASALKNSTSHWIIKSCFGEKLKNETKDMDVADLFNYLNKKADFIKLNTNLVKKFSDSEDYVMDALKGNGMLLEHVSDRLKNNPSICLTAFQNNRDSTKFFGKDIQIPDNSWEVCKWLSRVNEVKSSGLNQKDLAVELGKFMDEKKQMDNALDEKITQALKKQIETYKPVVQEDKLQVENKPKRVMKI